MMRSRYAPKTDCPHTRITLPLIASDAGDAKYAIVSATSMVSPPCCKEFSRRPTSRVTTGIAAVICVSMKPGATALTVIPWPADSENESTKPMTPALL